MRWCWWTVVCSRNKSPNSSALPFILIPPTWSLIVPSFTCGSLGTWKSYTKMTLDDLEWPLHVLFDLPIRHWVFDLWNLYDSFHQLLFEHHPLHRIQEMHTILKTVLRAVQTIAIFSLKKLSALASYELRIGEFGPNDHWNTHTTINHWIPAELILCDR